jgi:hypothetical protein
VAYGTNKLAIRQVSLIEDVEVEDAAGHEVLADVDDFTQHGLIADSDFLSLTKPEMMAFIKQNKVKINIEK